MTLGLLLLIVSQLFIVQNVRCDEEGLVFVEGFGTGKKIRWADVHSIEPAPRREVVVRGWLWPVYYKRETTATLSSTGHYRIRWDGEVAYFPPRDAARLVGWECAKVQLNLPTPSA